MLPEVSSTSFCSSQRFGLRLLAPPNPNNAGNVTSLTTPRKAPTAFVLQM